MKLCVYSVSKISNQLIVELDNNLGKVFFSFGGNSINHTIHNAIPSICENDYVFVANSFGKIPYFFSNKIAANYCLSLEGLNLLTKEAKINETEFSYNQKNTLIYHHMQRISLLNFVITPLIISDNCLGEYMFLVDDGSSKILITKDISPKSFIGQKKNKNTYYFKEVDYFIFNDFFYLNKKQKVITEREEQLQTMEIIEKNKYNFVFCKSSDLHHIANIYHILDSSYTFITTANIKVLLETSDNCVFLPQFKSSLYRFNRVKLIEDYDIIQLKKLNFLMILDPNVKYLELINQFDLTKVGLINSLPNEFHSNALNCHLLLLKFIKDNNFANIYSNSNSAKIADFKKLFNNLSVSKNYICCQDSLDDDKTKLLDKLIMYDDGITINIEKNQRISKNINFSSFDKDSSYDIYNIDSAETKIEEKKQIGSSILNYKEKIADIRYKYKSQQFQETSNAFDVSEYIKGYKHKSKENDIKNHKNKSVPGNSIDGF